MKLKCHACQSDNNINLLKFIFGKRNGKCSECGVLWVVNPYANSVINFVSYFFLIFLSFKAWLYQSWLWFGLCVLCYFCFEILKIKFLKANDK